MRDYSHAELGSVSCGLNPSPAFQAPSALGQTGSHASHSSAVSFVSPSGEGKD